MVMKKRTTKRTFVVVSSAAADQGCLEETETETETEKKKDKRTDANENRGNHLFWSAASRRDSVSSFRARDIISAATLG